MLSIIMTAADALMVALTGVRYVDSKSMWTSSTTSGNHADAFGLRNYGRSKSSILASDLLVILF